MHIVALAQQKGGVGKSAAAINLACQAVAAGNLAAVLDLDHVQGTTTKWGERRNGKAQPIVKAVDAANLETEIEELRKQRVKWVFLDLPGRAHPIIGAGIKAADLIIVPCRPLDVDIEASLDTVQRAIRAQKPYAYLMNIAPAEKEKQRAKQVAGFLRAHQHNVAEPIVVQRLEVPEAIADGKSASEARKGSKSGQEFADLFEWIAKEVRAKR